MAPVPAAFLERMRALLGESFPAFADSLSAPALRGLRANRLKITPDTLRRILSFDLKPVPWCPDGFYCLDPTAVRPAKHWAYRAGLFYLQEPSAMCAAQVLAPQPGERVLDLCAAPGGKTAQIAGMMGSGAEPSAPSSGLLVANDISASRCKALIKNLEMAGVTNAVVLNEPPYRLAARFGAFFDRVLVDAPCSGEGMFRRDPDAARAWSANKPEACAHAQREILRHAAAMVKPGGWLAYSTCTFNPEENEQTVCAFLDEHREFFLTPIDHAALGLLPARPDWASGPSASSLAHAARVFPHACAGEGFFSALMRRGGEPGICSADAPVSGPTDPAAGRSLPCPAPALYAAARENRGKKARPAVQTALTPYEQAVFNLFCAETLSDRAARVDPAALVKHHRTLLYVPPGLPDLRGLRVARGGFPLGEIDRERFTPSQAWAMALTPDGARFNARLSEAEAEMFLRGDSFAPSDAAQTQGIPEKAQVLVSISGFPVGWAKWTGGRLKNGLPKHYID